MRLFGHHRDDEAPLPNATTGIVLEAIAPPQGGERLRLRQAIVCDLGGGTTVVAPQPRVDRDAWFVVGQQVTVRFDPAAPDPAAPDLVQVDTTFASIEARIAAGDPTLIDPRAAHRAARAPLRGGVPVHEGDGYDEALAEAERTPSVDGRTAAIVVVATRREWFRERAHGFWDPSPLETDLRGGDAVLSVNVPRRPPYAILVERFKTPRDKLRDAPWLPATVSPSDPSDVAIRWDAVAARPTIRERVADVIDQRAADRQQVADALAAQHERIDAAAAAAAPAETPSTYAGVAHQQATMLASLQGPQRDAVLNSIRMALTRLPAETAAEYRAALLAEGVEGVEIDGR